MNPIWASPTAGRAIIITLGIIVLALGGVLLSTRAARREAVEVVALECAPPTPLVSPTVARTQPRTRAVGVVPPLDAEAPENTETATFALG